MISSFAEFRRVICRTLIVAALSLVWAGPVSWAQSQPSRDLVVTTGKGMAHRFHVEVAANDSERAKGLMFRKELPQNGGMLFDFATAQPVAMWMKNTLIPLDMLFVAENGRVVNIAERTVPGSLVPIPSDAPVRYVIELAGGTASRLDIRPGDNVTKGLTP
jgi:uncharacterized membrane protein (UPF0127 family)